MMKSGFKRKVAAFLAVLMTFNSVPLTTLGDMDTRFLGDAEIAAEEAYVEAVNAGLSDDIVIEVAGNDSEEESNSDTVETSGNEVSGEVSQGDPADTIAEDLDENSEEGSELTVAETTEESDESSIEETGDNTGLLTVTENPDTEIENLDIDVNEIEEVVEVDDVTAAPSFGMTLGTVFGEGGKATSDHYDEIKQEAHDRYDDNIMFSITPTGREEQKDVKAGESLTYNLNTFFLVPANYTYKESLPFYDEYKDVYVHITLPEGLVLTSVKGKDFWMDEATSSTYVFKMDTLSAITTQDPSYEITVFVTGNGTENAVTTYDLAEKDEDGNYKYPITLTASFDILDKYEPDKPLVETITQVYTTHIEDQLNVVSPDEWGVLKTADSAVISDTVNANGNKTVTVTYTVNVGLVKQYDDDSKQTVKELYPESDNRYLENGRDAIESLDLSDLLTATIDDGTESVDFLSATIAKGSYSQAITGSSVALTGDLALNQSADNKTVITDYTYNKTTKQLTAKNITVPVKTSYTVTAVYEIKDELVAHFAENAKTIHFSNRADLDAKLYNKATNST